MDEKSKKLVELFTLKIENYKKEYPDDLKLSFFLDDCLKTVINACENYWEDAMKYKHQVVDDFTGYKELPAERKGGITKFFQCAKCGVYGIPLFYDKCYFCNTLVCWVFSKEYTIEHKFYDQWMEYEKKIDF